MKCPKCSVSFEATPDEAGLVVCSGCGAKLRARPAAPPADPALLETILEEVRALRRAQDEILALLRARPETPAEQSMAPGEDEAVITPRVIRARRYKTVLLVDDQDESREAAVAALAKAEVPTRAVSDGRKGLEALSAERPDVLVLELAIGGSMGGKEVINMIKATMEWVDIPILLYTRAPLDSQKEARTVHGADDLVLKRSGPAALVARVITIFRRGS